MRVLAVDTSTAAVVCAVVELADRPRLLAGRTTVAAYAHGELLAPAMAACIEQAGPPAAVVVGTGPGPYTGLRVGLVSAAGYAAARGCPVYGVCSLDGIGATVPGSVLVATDARRKEVYWARYVEGVRVAGPAVCRPAELPRADATAGAGARLYADVIGLPLLDRDYPDPLALVTLAADRIAARAPSEILVPAYLREPHAVPPAAMSRP